MNQHNKALKIFEKTVQSNEQATTSAKMDTSLATKFHDYAVCLLDMNQQIKLANASKKTLQIKERATANDETAPSVTTILHLLGRCFGKMIRHNNALNCFERALQIKEHTTANAENDDVSLVVTLYSRGGCLLEMNEMNKAIKYFEKAQQIIHIIHYKKHVPKQTIAWLVLEFVWLTDFYRSIEAVILFFLVSEIVGNSKVHNKETCVIEVIFSTVQKVCQDC